MGVVQDMDGNEVISAAGVNETCIDCLEGILKKARDGEVVGVVAVVQYADGATSSPVGGFIRNSRIIGEMFVRMHMLSEGA